MCFSANASFAASGVLAVVGAASVSQTKTKRGIMYAAVPLVFAVQQLIEGFLWLTPGSGAASKALAYGFLFFAVIIWPAYVPAAVYLIEPEKEKRQLLIHFVILGAIVSIYAASTFLLNPIGVNNTLCCHIIYSFKMPLKYAVGGAYAVATCGSLLYSSRHWVRTLGVVTLLSLGVAYFYTAVSFVSVWCYFSAILSTLVLIHVRSQRNGHVSRKI
jgi:hypothetical protein